MEKINIAELLKDCPTGMELDCEIFDKPVKYMGLTKNETYIIAIKTSCDKIFYLTKEGYLYDTPDSKCVIFPKGKTTWEGFVPPCKFEDGDVLVHTQNQRFIMSIYHKRTTELIITTHCILWDRDEGLSINREICCYPDKTRLATEEEKERLFNAIKENGYKWNPETKTLEKITEPSFEVGNRVRLKDNHNIVFTITGIAEDYYVCGAAKAFWFMDQDKFELVPNKFDFTTLKHFDKVLARDSNIGRWDITFYECYDSKNGSFPYRTLGGGMYRQCIPYENNEHLVGLVKDCDEYYKNWK